MLIKKSGNSTESLIPLTTGYITDSEHTAEAYSSFKLDMMCSPDKVVFPGANAAFAARYACFDTSTNEYISTKGTVTTNGGGGDGGGCSYSNDAYYVNSLNAWKYNFHRISNWRDYATYKTDETESANYYSNDTKNVTQFETIVDEKTYKESINQDFYTDYSYIPKNQSAYWETRPGSWTSTINFYIEDAVDDGKPGEWCYAYAENTVVAAIGGDPQTYTAYFSAKCTNLREWASKHRTWPTYPQGSGCYKLYPVGGRGYYLSTPSTQLVGSVLLYTSGLTAIAHIDNLNEVSTITGDDIHLKFNNEGTSVTGSAYKGNDTSHTAKITANVDYMVTEKANSAAPEVTSNSGFSNYDWKTTGFINTVGGGGSFSYSFTSYLPNKNTKWAIYPRKNTKYIGYDANSYYNLSSKRIQDSYGGSILFSGENLDSYWNDNSRYFFIGFKGMNPYVTGTAGFSTTSNDTEMKIYKFNSDYFKKISKNTYYFEDKDISKIYANATASIANTNYRRHYAIGPHFYTLTAYTKTFNKDSVEHYSFVMSDVNNITHYVTPKVLNNIQYVNTLDIDEADDYFIVKPSNSIGFSYDPSLSNQGNTDTYSYFAYRLPTYWNGSLPSFTINSNATEISKLGTTMKRVQYMYGSNTNLTAIKTDWSNCTSMLQLDFHNSKLKQIPDSWNGLGNVTGLWNCFENCTQLTNIPTSWVGFSKLEGAASCFVNCSNLNEIPSSWNGLPKLTTASNMFTNCTKITKIPDDWSPLIKLNYVNEMFKGCTQLTGINSWQGWKITDSQGMFANCTHLIKVPNSWNGLGSVTRTNGMFSNCTDLTTIPTDLFEYCTNLSELAAMFSGCTSLTSDVQPIMDAGNSKIGLPDWTGFSGTFKGCTGVKNYDTLTSNTAYKMWFDL